MLLMVPHFLCGAGGAGGYTFLGFGDVVLPGLLLVYTCIHDLAFPPARGCACGYFAPACAGYGAGLLLTYGALLLELGGDQVCPSWKRLPMSELCWSPSMVTLRGCHTLPWWALLVLFIAWWHMYSWLSLPTKQATFNPRVARARLMGMGGGARGAQGCLGGLCAGSAGAAVPDSLHAGGDAGAELVAGGPARHVGGALRGARRHVRGRAGHGEGQPPALHPGGDRGQRGRAGAARGALVMHTAAQY